MTMPTVYAGIHHPAMAQHVPHTMVSINPLLNRRSDFYPNDWRLDSGASPLRRGALGRSARTAWPSAFSRITRGQGHLPVREYAAHVRRWSSCGNLQAAAAQDFMFEPFVLEITGLTVAQHQHLSTRNYLNLRELDTGTYTMPVLQGFHPDEYARHARQLSPELPEGAWTGVGSVCKRRGTPAGVARVITAIQDVRPDLKLHGFGVKTTALQDAAIAFRLHSVDSMAWSLAARRERFRQDPKSRNSLTACREWLEKVERIAPRPGVIPMGM